MSSERQQGRIEETERDMAAEAERMQGRLDDLDAHVDEARKKAAALPGRDGPGPGDPIEENAGDWEDTASTVNDPAGAIDDPPAGERP